MVGASPPSANAEVDPQHEDATNKKDAGEQNLPKSVLFWITKSDKKILIISAELKG